MMKTMRMKIYNKPNFSLAENKALDFIRKIEIKTLPIKLMQFKNIFNDLEIKKYSWYARTMGLSISEVCTQLGSMDGCCVYNERNGKTRIYYNDTIENEGRKRWTLAHELGHYALEHHKIYGTNIMQRSSISDEEYEIFEKEANCFARTLLAPPHVIYHIEDVNPLILQEICNISLEASVNIFNYIKRGVRNFGLSYSKKFAEELGFKKFLFDINNKYYCLNCRNTFILEKSNWCPCCGSHSLSKTYSNYGDDFNMKYTGIDLDNRYRAKTCPRCNNEELDYDGDYCNVCGMYLYNICTGLDPNQTYDYTYQGTRWGQFKQGCEGFLVGNARYCHKCGSTSSFFEEGILVHWELEKNNEINNIIPINNYHF